MDSCNTWRAIRDHLNSLDESDKRLDCQMFSYNSVTGENLPCQLLTNETPDEFIEVGDFFILVEGIVE